MSKMSIQEAKAIASSELRLVGWSSERINEFIQLRQGRYKTSPEQLAKVAVSSAIYERYVKEGGNIDYFHKNNSKR